MITEDFLLICARNNLNKNLIQKAKGFLKKGIDWNFFMENAARSGMPFVFYNSLKKIDYPALIPEDFIDELKISYLYVISKVTPQCREMMVLLSLFFEKGIPCVPLKGPILSKRLYGDAAARGISADIDLLIEEKNKGIVHTILEKKGYSFTPAGGIGERIGQYLFKRENSTAIDLHWEINPAVSSSERMKGFWKGIRLQEEDGIHYYEFKEEELLLQLSVHLVDSVHLIQLRYISDVNELLTKYKNILDWEDIVEKAKRWKLSNSLYTTLILSRSLFGSYVPDEALAKLKPALPKRILIKIFTDRKVILHPNSRPRQFMEKFLKYILFQILEAKSLKDYFAIVFPPKEKMGQKTYFRRITDGLLKFVGGIKTQ